MKLSRRVKDQRFQKAGEIIGSILQDPERYPDNTVMFLWGDEELSTIFTKERMRLLLTVKEQTYDSFSQLAEVLDRDVSKVRKDVKLLEGYGLLTLEKGEGNRYRIYSEAQGIYIPLEKTKPLEEHVHGITA